MIASHAERLRIIREMEAISGRIDALRADWKLACDTEDEIVRLYDKGRRTLDHVRAANQRSNERWRAYQDACTEGERLLALSQASRGVVAS